MSLKKSIFTTIVLLISVNAIAQRGGRRGGDYNRLGIQGGYSIFDIKTDDLQTQSQGSFQAGFTTRGSYRNNFDMIYGISFFQNNIGINAKAFDSNFNSGAAQEINFSIIGAQLNLLASYNIIKHHLSIEAGPMLMINGKMKVEDERLESFIIEGYSTTSAKDLENINSINGAALIGITGGHENFRLNINYQYGFTNILDGLNDEGLENKDFKGNTTTIVIAAIIYF